MEEPSRRRRWGVERSRSAASRSTAGCANCDDAAEPRAVILQPLPAALSTAQTGRISFRIDSGLPRAFRHLLDICPTPEPVLAQSGAHNTRMILSLIVSSRRPPSTGDHAG